MTRDGQAHIAIDACENAPAALCGRIVWAEPPISPEEAYDRRNPDPTLRGRPIVGLPILWGFVPSAPGNWTGGKVYDPTRGSTWDAKLTQSQPDALDIAGCLLFVCLGETWRRLVPVTSSD
ncbi:MAG: DUF2147 domain-containing protein [Geminicoccaceae bacterium]